MVGTSILGSWNSHWQNDGNLYGDLWGSMEMFAMMQSHRHQTVTEHPARCRQEMDRVVQSNAQFATYQVPSNSIWPTPCLAAWKKNNGGQSNDTSLCYIQYLKIPKSLQWVSILVVYWWKKNDIISRDVRFRFKWCGCNVSPLVGMCQSETGQTAADWNGFNLQIYFGGLSISPFHIVIYIYMCVCVCDLSQYPKMVSEKTLRRLQNE